MSRYVNRKYVRGFPRLPLRGSLDLTYRCNNSCCHCWLRVASDSPEKSRELGFSEIRRIVDEARRMGCRKWSISGGEPMLREDFPDIFDYITSQAAYYTLNTNGTLITPAIARIMKKRGAKLIALYGATPDVHDKITGTAGSFDRLCQGISYLREAGAGYTIQIVPMNDNYHQFEDMVRLAESWSSSWRLGASWLYPSADGDPGRNREILMQRLSPTEVLELDRPDVAADSYFDEDVLSPCSAGGQEGLYSACIDTRREFHVDPYGGMSFCCFVKDPALRCDLRTMSFAKAWDDCIPSLATKIKADERYLENCGHCDLREDCRWCAVFGFLENRNHSSKVDYLCGIARETKRFKDNWQRSHRRYYRIAGITVQVDADLPITDATFHPKFEAFRVEESGDEVLRIHHHFSLPDLETADLGEEVYRRPPWVIYKKNDSWIYVGIYPHPEDRRVTRIIVFNKDHTRARIYSATRDLFLRGFMDSLLLLSSDQILLARVLPRWGGAFIHAAGVIFNGQGMLFAGPSEAGKSTMVKMLKKKAKILCDDRMIIRRQDDGFTIHGTWSHGEIPLISPDSAPFLSLFFLRQSSENRIERIDERKAIVQDLLARIVRPLVTADWWEDVLSLAGDLTKQVPFYNLYFDKSGKIVDALEALTEKS